MQPLAGEFAARREVLNAVPFFTGYGVEIGMLIDVYNQVGLDAMAQVDVGTRQNRHQSLADLGRMSSVVLRTLAAREGVSARCLETADGNLWDAHQPATYLHAVATEHGLPPRRAPQRARGAPADGLPHRRQRRPGWRLTPVGAWPRLAPLTPAVAHHRRFWKGNNFPFQKRRKRLPSCFPVTWRGAAGNIVALSLKHEHTRRPAA